MSTNLHTRRSFLVSGAAAGPLAAAAQSSQSGARGPGKPIRMGVVGGNFGRQFPWHLHPDGKVAAVCDIRPDRVDAMMTAFKCDTKYRSFQEMLKQKDLDAVAIFTPVPMHAWMVVEALSKHVISAVVAAMSE